MRKQSLLTLLAIPFLLCSCSNGGNSGESGSEGDYSSASTPEDAEEYDAWLNSWSKPGHLYFHYNRGSKAGYENYCLWLWQHSPEDSEGALWAFSGDPKVSPTLTLQPMSNHWMTVGEIEGNDKNATFLDKFGVIADVDLYASNLVGGKTGKATSYEGMEEIGFLLPQENSMDGTTNWTSDGGKNTYIDDIADPANWRDVGEGKAIHIFVSTGSLDEHAYYAGSGVAEAKTNPIDEDTSGNYRSDIDAAYSNALGNTPTSEDFKDDGTGYQIFVASFRDSNGDGLGDLRGIIDALDEGYFTDLGIDVLWLTPIQKSDSYHGYDISDYYAVDKKFGTVQDYQELIYKAHQKGMKVLMDLVLNHTSKSNKWFINSQWGLTDANAGINWRDVYTWKFESDTIDKWDGSKYVTMTVKEDAESKNPSWYRDGESHYYYYGKFGSGMPEINYLSAVTRKLVIDMAKYWMSFGLDGFRLDAVKHIFMRDECYQSGDKIIQDVGSARTYDDEKGIYVTKGFDYSSNLDKNIMWWKEFAHGVKSVYPNCFLVGENFDGWGTRTAPYYQALDSQFDFSLYYHNAAYLNYGDGTYFKGQPKETYVPFASSATQELKSESGTTYVPGGARTDFIDGPFTSNHDVMRAINQANGTGSAKETIAKGAIYTDDKGNDLVNGKITGTPEEISKAKAHAALTILSQGVSWIYYGDELGMSSNLDKHLGLYGSQNSKDIWYRQPFKWSNEALRPNYKAGAYVFEYDDYNKNTLKDLDAQKSDANSMYNWYKALCEIKQQYPHGAMIEFDESTGTSTVVLKVTGSTGKMAVYINIGRTDGAYNMEPDLLLGVTTSKVGKGIGSGASLDKHGDIGSAGLGVCAFKS